MNQSKHVIFCNFVLDREIHMWALWCGEYYRTKVSINFSPPLLSKVTERQCCCLSRHRFKCCTIVSEKSSKSSTSRIKFSRNCKYNEMSKESITKLQVCASWWHFSQRSFYKRIIYKNQWISLMYSLILTTSGVFCYGFRVNVNLTYHYFVSS